jgi:DNA-binding NtrC family response regulator
MRKHIEAALTVADGQIEGQHGVAALLDVNPHTLRAKMRKLGIDWAAFRRGGAKTDRPRSHPPTPHAAPW